MTMSDIVTIAIAIYGAILATISMTLSTILGVNELRKGKRKVIIFLDYVAWYERAQLTITNVGYGPITIVELEMVVRSDQNGREFWEAVPRDALFVAEEEPLPQTIGDGEHVIVPLADKVSRDLSSNNMRARISVYDSEGHKFTEFKTRLANPKWGRYDEIKK